MSTPDTSVVVAGFASWHEKHPQARGSMQESDRLIAHVALEAFSVLTRMPPPQRASPSSVVEFLQHHFPAPRFVLSSAGYGSLLSVSAERGISGGAIYDAVVAMTAREAKALLITLDERAANTYQAIGADFRLLR